MWRTMATRSLLNASRRLGSRSLSSVAAAATGGQELEHLTSAMPHFDVVRYQHKNRVWSLNHVQYFSEALAIGLLENGLQKGDKVLSWLPEHFSEQMVLQFACSKAGLVLYSLDPTASADTDRAKQALEAALTVTEANVLVTPETHDDVNYLSLCKDVIPETRIFDFANGMPFVTPRFPHLRLPIQTGFDQNDEGNLGFLLLRHMIVPSDNLDSLSDAKGMTPDTPLAGQLSLGSDGVPSGLGKTLTHAQVVSQTVWPTYCKVLKKEFHDVSGVGVIF